MSTIVAILFRIGLVHVDAAGKTHWPFSTTPWWLVKAMYFPHHYPGEPRPKRAPLFYVFRNRPGIVKWIPGRLLPRRWGFGFMGLEFGDRGHR